VSFVRFRTLSFESISRFSLSINTLTTQVRGFARISAAAMDSDFTRFITVEASGEMDSFEDPNQSNGVQPER
jgi:hypothetical protein